MKSICVVKNADEIAIFDLEIPLFSTPEEKLNFNDFQMELGDVIGIYDDRDRFYYNLIYFRGMYEKYCNWETINNIFNKYSRVHIHEILQLVEIRKTDHYILYKTPRGHLIMELHIVNDKSLVRTYILFRDQKEYNEYFLLEKK